MHLENDVVKNQGEESTKLEIGMGPVCVILNTKLDSGTVEIFKEIAMGRLGAKVQYLETIKRLPSKEEEVGERFDILFSVAAENSNIDFWNRCREWEVSPVEMVVSDLMFGKTQYDENTILRLKKDYCSWNADEVD